MRTDVPAQDVCQTSQIPTQKCVGFPQITACATSLARYAEVSIALSVQTLQLVFVHQSNKLFILQLQASCGRVAEAAAAAVTQ